MEMYWKLIRLCESSGIKLKPHNNFSKRIGKNKFQREHSDKSKYTDQAKDP